MALSSAFQNKGFFKPGNSIFQGLQIPCRETFLDAFSMAFQ